MNKRFLVGIIGVVVLVVTACIGRDKVEKYNGVSYSDNCIFDNANTVSDKKELEDSLKKFYDKTGIQPYILLPGYMRSIDSQARADEYAEEFFNDSLSESRSILFVYYQNYDESEVGYYSLIMGNALEQEFKSEFEKVFAEEAEKYILNSSFSMGEAIDEIFSNTAEELFY